MTRIEGTAHDVIVVGGGVMGSSAAIRMADAGMRVLLLEANQLGLGASGVNAGTLSLQIKRVALMPYALRGHALWKAAGEKVGYHEIGGLTVAFTEREEQLLKERMAARAAAGAPIEIVDGEAARTIEPRLSRSVRAASHCPEDAYANSSLTGQYYRRLLDEAGVEIQENCPVTEIIPERDGVVIRIHDGTLLRASRLLLAAGAWTRKLALPLGIDLPIKARINMVSVTERMPELIHSVLGHATGLLTMKQSGNGTILIGGGWQGSGTPETGRGQVSISNLVHNLRLAISVLPDLAAGRIVRTWTGFEANTPDFFPLAGAMPGFDNIFVLAAVRGGYTIGPFIGRLMGDLILEREPEMPLFDPSRFATKESADAAAG